VSVAENRKRPRDEDDDPELRKRRKKLAEVKLALEEQEIEKKMKKAEKAEKLEAEAKKEAEKLIAKAEKKREAIKMSDMSWLEDPTKRALIPHPSLSGEVSPRFAFERDTGDFMFMGRLSLGKLIAGLTEAKDTKVNVLGTKTYGKSHIIAAYVAKRMQSHFKGDANARPVLFLPKCGDLAKHRALYLKDAMLLAFAADDKQLAEIAALPKETEELLRWLNTKTFDVVADQGNDIEEDCRLGADVKQKTKHILERLEDIVLSQGCKIVIGYSANNEIMRLKFFKERTETDLEFYGGFEEKVCASLRLFVCWLCVCWLIVFARRST
jgi:hypothetical protein